MEKINSSVEKVIRSCLIQIAGETDYDLETMNTIVTKYLNKDEPCSQCHATVPSGRQCSNTALQTSTFCKRHLFFQPPVVKCQCVALTKNGTRCLRDAKLEPGTTTAFCGLHIGKARRDLRKIDVVGCMFYDEADDTELVFCKNPCVHEQWCCQEHKHLEAMNKKMYKFNHLGAYINNKSDPVHVPHPIIEQMLLQKNITV
jgi:hypothetical protein|tara:strand:- start:15817 stop:16419 length:603 start_codon:yes stop_codon:yes gene_type:complete